MTVEEALNRETVPFPEHALALLALTLAAGGTIAVTPHDMATVNLYKLVVSEDVATGAKRYSAVRIEN